MEINVCVFFVACLLWDLVVEYIIHICIEMSRGTYKPAYQRHTSLSIHLYCTVTKILEEFSEQKFRKQNELQLKQ